ncbi:hypothetical protein IPL68_01490 [Candidatus Saccharibacteria bacterium]|nr:MAG: hypothetical protein IPL68_01490 [Candidatus Saccharibacteria bacterium]
MVDIGSNDSGFCRQDVHLAFLCRTKQHVFFFVTDIAFLSHASESVGIIDVEYKTGEVGL